MKLYIMQAKRRLSFDIVFLITHQAFLVLADLLIPGKLSAILNSILYISCWQSKAFQLLAASHGPPAIQDL